MQETEQRITQRRLGQISGKPDYIVKILCEPDWGYSSFLLDTIWERST